MFVPETIKNLLYDKLDKVSRTNLEIVKIDPRMAGGYIGVVMAFMRYWTLFTFFSLIKSPYREMGARMF